MITDIEVKIVPIKHSLTGYPGTELLITGVVDGVIKHWSSRFWWVVIDSPHARAAEIAAFKKRQEARTAEIAAFEKRKMLNAVH